MCFLNIATGPDMWSPAVIRFTANRYSGTVIGTPIRGTGSCVADANSGSTAAGIRRGFGNTGAKTGFDERPRGFAARPFFMIRDCADLRERRWDFHWTVL